jgi:hydrogenase maturation protein HypF
VFDAAAALLGLCNHMLYEAQAPVLLAQAATNFIATHDWPAPLPGAWHIDDKAQLDLLPLLGTLVAAPDVGAGAAQFHATLVAALTDWAQQACAKSGLNTVVFGGGCFLNHLLTPHLRQNLEIKGVTLLTPTHTSPGDASIALGQAWVALHHLETTQCV